ncbi:MAG: efflux RND transporter periplasmic adaptor subunit [Pirellulales bacterium]
MHAPQPSPGATLFCGCLAVLALLAGCRYQAADESDPAEAAAAAPAPKLKVARVELRHWPRVIRVQGSLLGDERAVVGAKVAGRVKEVGVDLGSVVNQGDPLVALETESLDLAVKQAEAQVEQARAQLGLKPGDNEETLNRTTVPSVLQEQALRDEAKAMLDRSTALVAKRAITAEQLQQRQAASHVADAKYVAALNGVDELLAELKVRRAELALARQKCDDAVIRAPFEGVVQERQVMPGEYLQVGDAAVSLVRTNPLRFRAGVPEREASRVRPKQEVRIEVEGHADSFRAEVSRVSPALDLTNRSLIVEADLPNPNARLRVGLFAEADIVVDPAARVLAVPAAAVTRFAGVEKVWVIRGDQVASRLVEIGRRSETLAEILDGVAAGDLVACDARLARPGRVSVEISSIADAPASPSPPVEPPTDRLPTKAAQTPGGAAASPAGIAPTAGSSDPRFSRRSLSP